MRGRTRTEETFFKIIIIIHIQKQGLSLPPLEVEITGVDKAEKLFKMIKMFANLGCDSIVNIFHTVDDTLSYLCPNFYPYLNILEYKLFFDQAVNLGI